MYLIFCKLIIVNFFMLIKVLKIKDAYATFRIDFNLDIYPLSHFNFEVDKLANVEITPIYLHTNDFRQPLSNFQIIVETEEDE